MPGWKSTLPLLGPVLILAVAGLVWWPPRGGKDKAPPPSKVEATEEVWEEVDFTALRPGGTIPEWEVMQGAFQIMEKDGRIMLEMQYEPMVEGKVRWSRVLTGGGAVRARMRGDRTRRAAPRFCVSLLGESEIQLRAAPLKDVVEIAVPVIPERVLASVPWKGWQPDRWVWLEFRILPRALPDGGTGSLFEGRVWLEGEPRPVEPTIRYESPAAPGVPRPVLEGAPYALRPIYYDRLGALRFHR